MTEAGVPFVEALEAVGVSARTAALHRRHAHGHRRRPVSLDRHDAVGHLPVIVGDMLKVAEDGGKLDATLSAAADHLERSVELRKRVMNAMLYPLVTVSIFILTVAALIVFVIPALRGDLRELKADLPITTKAMLATSTFVRANPLVTILGIVGVVLAIRFALRLPAVGNFASKMLLRLPGIGPLLRIWGSRAPSTPCRPSSAATCRLTSLEHGSRISGNPTIEAALMQARRSVESGRSFSDALAETKVFPTMLVQIVGVGERTGRLGPLMETYSHCMEQEVDARLKSWWPSSSR